MQLTVDHVSVGVAELQVGIDVFTALGFELANAGPQDAHIHTETGSLVLTRSQEFSGLGVINISSEEPVDITGKQLPLAFTQSGAPANRAGNHPNGVLRLERVYIAVPDVRNAAREYASALHMAVPAQQRGKVIKATMCVFDVGRVGIVVAEPVEAGPAAEALARTGGGLFQVLFRVRELAAASRWMTEHGLREPERGTRNTGEAAILVGPEQACGAYIAFVGPP